MPPRYSPEEVLRVLRQFGWVPNRLRGSHVILTKEGQNGQVTVSMNGRQVPPGTLANILRQAGLRRRQLLAAAEQLL